MLIETLNKLQTDRVEIRPCGAQVRNTGITNEAPANLGGAEIARQRFQRMRRRHQRATSARNAMRGWVARVA